MTRPSTNTDQVVLDMLEFLYKQRDAYVMGSCPETSATLDHVLALDRELVFKDVLAKFHEIIEANTK